MRDYANMNDEITAIFGFKSVKTPTKNYNLNRLESDLYDSMVQNIEFKKVKSIFQMQLSNDVKKIKTNSKLLIPADKTNNLYKPTTDEYNKKYYLKTLLKRVKYYRTYYKC